jgi:hypothetical protein
VGVGRKKFRGAGIDLRDAHPAKVYRFNEDIKLVKSQSATMLATGKTPGKWVARTKAMSLTSDRLGGWQPVERVLGYGAAVLEGGPGFVELSWDRNRMYAQDRLAETIVVDLRKR